MLRILLLLIGLVYCDAGVASGLHAPASFLTGGIVTSPALLPNAAPLAAPVAAPLATPAAPLLGGYGGHGFGYGGPGFGYGPLGYGAGGFSGFGGFGGFGGYGLAPAGLGLATSGVAYGPGSLGLSGVGLAPLAGPVPAAIQSHRSYEVAPVVLQQDQAVPQVIEVEADEQPVQVVFRSASSRVLVQQVHTPGAPGQVEATHSEDEPHRVLHEVLRPVIQEVREVIQPYRRVTQEVRPVVEEVHTVVAKGEPRLRTAVAPVAAAPALVGDGGLVSYGGTSPWRWSVWC